MQAGHLPSLDRGPRVIVVMGVSGSGKSTVAACLAERLGWAFVDGDDFHSAAHVAKMRAGHPLDDDDRAPWLEIVGRTLHEHGERGDGLVVACSALKGMYRDQIRSQAPAALFLHLSGSLEVLTRRIEGRSGHFMPAALLQSQIDTLEPLAGDEDGYVLDINQPVAEMVREAVVHLRELVTARS